MNLLFSICGRAGSKGVKNKNIRSFLGLPLYEYTFAAIDLYIEQNGHLFEHIDIAINTDSKDFIAAVNQKFPSRYFIINREEHLCGDTVAKMDVIRNSLFVSEAEFGYCYDCIVDLDITSPLRTCANIAEAINKKLADPTCDVVFSVVESRRNPYFNMVRKKENEYFCKVLESEYTARQQAPRLYDLNASIYAYARAFLSDEKNKSPLDSNAGIVEMSDTGILDIDSENDFQLIQVMAEYLYREDPALGEVYARAQGYKNNGEKRKA